MREKTLTLLKYTLAVLLGCFELAVLILAFRPQVSEAYRVHYIDRTSGCFAKPDWRREILAQPQPHKLVFGGMQTRTACVYLPDGWRAPGGESVRANQPRARIMIPVGVSTSRAVLALEASDQDQPLVVILKGRVIWRGVLQEKHRIEVPIALSAGDADQDRLVRLDLTDGRNDNRDVRFLLYSITVD